MALRALLLSPDDQAVHAITSVLEEMSVSCDRPLDGATAAKKLNSERFDLVVVDCENLPAAKLIFDVCRRSHGASVPVAIVDGRAGLPTAFRLGAELILTKPVAMDQARATIRTAVSRTRKDQPAQDAKPETIGAVEKQQEGPFPKAMAAAAGAGLGASAQTTVAGAATTPVLVQAAAASSYVPSAAAVSHASPPIVSTSFHVSAAATAAATAVEPVVTPSAPVTSPPKQAVSEASTQASSPEKQLLEDRVMAALENDEPPQTSPTFSAREEPKPQRSRSLLLATLLLVLAGGVGYAGWMYQPGFRKFIELRFAQGKTLLGLPAKGPVVAPRPNPPVVPVKPPQVAPPPFSSSTAQPSSATGTSATSTEKPSDQTTSTNDTSTPSVTPATALAGSSTSEPEKKTGTTDALASAFPEAKGAVILSSKGAEKRLLHRVAPLLPAAARAQSAEATVVLKALIDESGAVKAVQPVEGNAVLLGAAMKAVKQWRYKPYSRDGKVLPFQTVVLVDFQ